MRSKRERRPSWPTGVGGRRSWSVSASLARLVLREAGRRPDLACAVGPQMRTGAASGYGTGFLYGRRRPAGLAASVY